MRQNNARITKVQNRVTASNPPRIGDVFILAKCENDQIILIIENRGTKAESIDIYYEEPSSLGQKGLESFHLPCYDSQKVLLPHGFEKWKRLYFKVGKEERRVSNPSLKKLLDTIKRQMKIEPSRSETELLTSKPEQSSDPSLDPVRENTKKLRERVPERSNITEHTSVHYRDKAEKAVRDAQERVAKLTCAYREGEPIDFLGIETPTSSQKVLLFLNLLARNISQWRAELEQSGEVDPNLVDTLTYREREIKDKLKAVRGETPPVPNLLNLETDISTDTELNHIRNQCALYVARFEGRLFGYEERCKIEDLTEYNEFIPQFIKDRLFNGVARFISPERLPKQLDGFLQLVGYEVVPIEIGKTKADARVHEIQGSRQVGVEPGTIIEVILPGLRWITDGEIVQKPVVIRGE